MLHLAFKRRIDGIPSSPVGLFGSKLNLAFTDVSQVWTNTKEFGERTVLAVSCSEPYALTGHAPQDGHAIMTELARYLPFRPGKKWNQSPDVDWDLTAYHSNADAQLSLNVIGTDVYRPEAKSESLANVFFAGDFCRHNHKVGLTTVEAAVASGQAAAAAIVSARRLRDPIEILQPDPPPDALYVFMRYAWGPAALAAKVWSRLTEQAERGSPLTARLAGEQDQKGKENVEQSLVRYLLTPGLTPRSRAHKG
jgi:hypothetical protein